MAAQENNCIREKCYCWEKSCQAIEARHMKAAVKRGDDPEGERFKTCPYPSEGTDEKDPAYGWMNATRWMKYRDKK